MADLSVAAMVLLGSSPAFAEEAAVGPPADTSSTAETQAAPADTASVTAPAATTEPAPVEPAPVVPDAPVASDPLVTEVVPDPVVTPPTTPATTPTDNASANGTDTPTTETQQEPSAPAVAETTPADPFSGADLSPRLGQTTLANRATQAAILMRGLAGLQWNSSLMMSSRRSLQIS